MRKSVLLLLLLSFFPLSLFSQQLEPFRNVVSNGYNFWVYTPPHGHSSDSSYGSGTESLRKPLVIFLHGASLCGKDLARVRRYGVLHAIQMGLDLDGYVLAPQNPGGAWKPSNINQCLDYVVAHYPVDTNRIYVIGMSLGGFGTIDYLAVYHNRVAAAMAICGGGNPKEYCGLNEVPLWIVHGNADKQVSINASYKVINAMRRCDEMLPRLIFTELDGVNHTFPARLFYLESTYNWLFEHRRNDLVRLPNQSYSISTDDMKNAYRTLRRRAEPLKVLSASVGQTGSQTDAPSDVKSAKTKTSGNASAQYYKVKRGDSLGKIASRNNTTIAKLCKLNGLSRNAKIYEGQKIRVR